MSIWICDTAPVCVCSGRAGDCQCNIRRAFGGVCPDCAAELVRICCNCGCTNERPCLVGIATEPCGWSEKESDYCTACMPLVRKLRRMGVGRGMVGLRRRAAFGLVSAILLLACGSPFEAQQIGPPPHEGGADVLADVVLTPDARPVDARPSDAGADARGHHEGGADVLADVAPDAPADAAPPKDAAPSDVAADVAAEACALPPASLDVCGGMPAGGVEYCIQLGGGTSDPHTATPAACRCLADYTCACVLAAAADPCAGHGSLVDCLTYDGVPVVRCN